MLESIWHWRKLFPCANESHSAPNLFVKFTLKLGQIFLMISCRMRRVQDTRTKAIYTQVIRIFCYVHYCFLATTLWHIYQIPRPHCYYWWNSVVIDFCSLISQNTVRRRTSTSAIHFAEGLFPSLFVAVACNDLKKTEITSTKYYHELCNRL